MLNISLAQNTLKKRTLMVEMKILIYEFKLFIDSPLFGTIVFHEEEINENKKGKGNLAVLYNEEAEREPVILHKFCLPCVTHFHRCKETFALIEILAIARLQNTHPLICIRIDMPRSSKHTV